MNFEELKANLQNNAVELVAVSKTKPVDQIRGVYEKGQRIFGENRVQELVKKQPALPRDIEWHMIGHLQRNKVKQIAPFISMIHSVDNFRLLAEINKQALKNDRTINCLLQFHIAREESKSGMSMEEATEGLSSEEFGEMENVSICGVMGMATFTSDEKQVRQEFRILKEIFTDLKSRFFNAKDSFQHISMGMSGDFEIAVEEGSTMVRIGSLIFGSRG